MKLTVLLVTGFASAALARNSLSVFYTFPGSGSAGEPLSPIIQASDGNFYGTASGAYPSVGVVFRITPSGQFTVVYNFPLDNATQTAPNGVVPYGQLLEARDGYLWGTTRDGGVGKQNCAGVYGCGTVFRVSKDGTSFQSVYAFCTQPTCPDGASPQGGLTQTANGTIYGTTYGTTFSTIFQVVSLNSVQTLSKFNSTTGCWIRTGLTQASDGLLYGVASACGQSGGGTVFQATPAGVVNVLHNFGIATPAGSGPSGQLIQGISGKLYGTTLSGGTSGGCGGNGCGTVFEIDTTGGFQTLYNFDSNTTGNGPLGGLLQSSGGNLWGTTISGPKTGLGVVYELTSTGSLVQVLPLDYYNTGGAPYGNLLWASDGNLYRTASYGGANATGLGTIFVVNTAAPPRPAIRGFSPATGAAGVRVLIRGAHFIGATAVTFNGVAATFTVLNVNSIRAVVPPGATTGPISVKTAAGTATRKSVFTVQ